MKFDFAMTLKNQKFAKISIRELSKIEKFAKVSLREIRRSVIRKNYFPRKLKYPRKLISAKINDYEVYFLALDLTFCICLGSFLSSK